MDEKQVATRTNRPDEQLHEDVAFMLCAGADVPGDRIEVHVADGWVTLEGAVPWHYHRDEAEAAVQYVTGVAGVTNRIEVDPRATAGAVKESIRETLLRAAELDARRITIRERDGEVTLLGTVRSRAEREQAETAALGVAGVVAVRNALRVVE